MPHVRINGARLWYEVRGTGRPVLLHHGYTASRVNWMPVAERLEARYQIILMECRGTGASEHTDNGYTLQQYAADVVAMLDHLGLATVTFAGHSMGGGIGYLLGLDHPQRLDGLILMAPIPADGIGEVDQKLREQRRQMRRRGDSAAILALYQAQRFRPEVETDAWFESRVEHILNVSDGHYEGSADSMRELRVSHRLAQLTIPTLMISGAVDGLLKTNLEDFLKLPNATLQVLSRAGHEVAVHEPDAVTRTIADFMEYGPITAEHLMTRSA